MSTYDIKSDLKKLFKDKDEKTIDATVTQLISALKNAAEEAKGEIEMQDPSPSYPQSTLPVHDVRGAVDALERQGIVVDGKKMPPIESLIPSSIKPVGKTRRDVLPHKIDTSEDVAQPIIVDSENDFRYFEWEKRFDNIANLVSGEYRLRKCLAQIKRRRRINNCLDKVGLKWRVSTSKQMSLVAQSITEMMLRINGLDNASLRLIDDLAKNSTTEGIMRQLPRVDWDSLASELELSK